MISKEEWDKFFDSKSEYYSRKTQHDILTRETNAYLATGNVITKRLKGKTVFYTKDASGNDVYFDENGELLHV